MRKLAALALIAALGLVSQGASCGSSVKDGAGKAIVAAEAAYHVAVEAELALRCGEPTSLPAPNCISPEQHAQLKAVLLQIYNPGPPPSGYLAEAKELYALLPDGAPNAQQIFALISKIGEIVQQVIAGLPQSAPKAVAAAADPNVLKTIATSKGVK